MPAPKVRSKDSVQQRLRDHKRQWNSVYKDFSQKLKAFKDGMNGRGNAKVGLPPSNIKEPMPAEIGSYLSQLATEFQTIVSDAESIMAEQEQYARTRRRRRPKAPKAPEQEQAAPAAPQPTEAPPQVAENLNRLGVSQYELEKEASNRLTRFWQYLTAIFSSREFNRQRVGLLSQAADLYYSLLDLQNATLSMGMQSIPNAIGEYKKFKYTYDTLTNNFQGVRRMVEKKAEQAGITKPTEAPTAQPQPQVKPTTAPPVSAGSVEKIKEDIHLLFNANLAKEAVQKLNNMIDDYEAEKDPGTKKLWEDQIKEVYKGLTKHLATEVQKRYGPVNIRSVQDLIDIVKKNKTADYTSNMMIKESHNVLTRALKRKWVKLRTSNKTASVRLQIDESIETMKGIIKKIMDNLEKELSVENLVDLFEDLEEEREGIRRPIHVLNIVHMKDFFAKKERKQPGKGKRGPMNEEELMDWVLQRKLKRELSEDLT